MGGELGLQPRHSTCDDLANRRRFLLRAQPPGLDAAQREQIVRRTPLGRLGGVDDVVGAVRFLLSHDASFITGQTLIIDGGITC
jgi:NAD(P)-dependent dehydrogenase (short-subunit alcohol dehydrogenase family)